ncbi:forkhead box protein J1-like [Falco cherrug]|uniref:forkhead box protein J1-like n=1 Tax=Falco cherrug TaxID=345164 RepID=UPI00247A27EB|nr:forkhead box protein J1-like [Falco cherrug]
MAEGWLNSLQAGKDRGHTGSVGDSHDLNDSLTSLMWLCDFSIVGIALDESSCCPSGPDPHNGHKVPSFAPPCSPTTSDTACMGISHTPCPASSSCTSSTANHPVAVHPQLAGDIDYKTNPHVKPPYSYATLIRMAMEASKKPKISVSDIYKWIMDNFCYFRHADPTWQSSIRHNLSLNKCFIKVPREKGEPGKGGFWKLDPQHAGQLENGAVKKRRTPPVQIHPAFTNGAQPGAPFATSPAAPACTSSSILTVNTQLQQLLKEFEEVTGGHNANAADGKAGHKRRHSSPKRTAKVPRLSSSALLTQEEQTELGSLEGDFDWEAIFNTSLDGDFSALGDLDLMPAISPVTHNLDLAVHGDHVDCPQGQEQVLTESNKNILDLDETFMATSFLQHAWDEGTNDYLSNCANMEQLFDLNDAALLADEHGPG